MYKLKCLGVWAKYYWLIQSFLSDRFQRDALNGQFSNWCHIKAGVPQGSILGPLWSTWRINISCQIVWRWHFTFFVVRDPKTTSQSLSEDLSRINRWASQLKMLFNPYTSKQTQVLVFSTQGTVFFNNRPIVKKNIWKHLGLFLDTKLNFLTHINEKNKKANKAISVIKKLNLSSQLSSLITIYKSFVRPQLDHGGII